MSQTNIDYSFDNCYTIGHKYEDAVIPYLEKKFNTKIRPARDRYLQKRGIDLVADNGLKFEVKTQNYDIYKRYMNTLSVETKSIIENNIPGWCFTCSSDYIVYVWGSFGHLEIKKITLYDWKQFKEWFKENIEKYPEHKTTSKRNGEVWHSLYATIPIKDIPKKIMQEIKV